MGVWFVAVVFVISAGADAGRPVAAPRDGVLSGPSGSSDQYGGDKKARTFLATSSPGRMRIIWSSVW